MKRKLVLLVICFLLAFQCFSAAASSKLKDVIADRTTVYSIRLNNGDIITGYCVEMLSDPEEGEGAKFATELGNATIFENQIVEIVKIEDLYRHNHRIYLLPTAEPIGRNHFIGNFELLIFYAGFGISDFMSVTAGRSVIPDVPSKEQVTLFNVKVTPLSFPIEDVAELFTVALGANLGFINHNNRFLHYYGNATMRLKRTTFTAALFYKAGGNDINILNFRENVWDMTYENGSFGIGLGLDTKFTKRSDLHFIGEIWNSNVAHPTHSAVMLGLRLANSSFSSDFGLAFLLRRLSFRLLVLFGLHFKIKLFYIFCCLYNVL